MCGTIFDALETILGSGMAWDFEIMIGLTSVFKSKIYVCKYKLMICYFFLFRSYTWSASSKKVFGLGQAPQFIRFLIW